MYKFLLTYLCLLLLLPSYAQISAAGEFNIRINDVELDYPNSKVYFDIEVKADAAATSFNIADMNFRFSYNRYIFIPSSLEIEEELELSGFAPPAAPNSIYDPHTTTGSLDTVCSYNISMGGGIGIWLNETDWVKVGRLSLGLTGNSGTGELFYHCEPGIFPPVTINGKEDNQLYSAQQGTTNTPCLGIIIPTDPSLPISFSSFTGELKDNRTVELNWKTASEVNVSHFDIERSTNGADFVKLFSKQATGTPNAPMSYTDFDGNPQNGKNYYRIVSVDLNGELAYSSIVEINLDRNLGLDIFPVPANEVINVNVTGSPSSTVTLTVTNALGQILDQQEIEKGAYVDYSTTYDVRSLAAGTYFMSISNDTHAIHKKFIVK